MAFEIPVIIYNSYTLPLLVGRYSARREGKRFHFTQDFLVAANDTINTAALFNTACTNAEVALNNANAALSVTWEGQTLYSFDPAANTGLVTRAAAIKRGDVNHDNLRSRLYSFEFTCELPASEFRTDASELGYFETNVTMFADTTNRPTFVFTGEYRSEKNISGGAESAISLYDDATNGGRARALAWLNSNASTWAGAAYFAYSSAGGGNYEKIEETIPGLGDGAGREPIINPYRLVYRFRSIPELSSGAGTADYTVDALEVTYLRSRSIAQAVPVPDGSGSAGGGGGNTPDSAPAARKVGGGASSAGGAFFGDASLVFQITASIAVPLSSTTDWNNLAGVYETSIKPWFEAHLAGVWAPPGGTWELESESVPIRTDANRIQIAWVVNVPNSHNFIKLDYALTYIRDWRKVFHKLADPSKPDDWDEHSPGPAKFLVQRAKGTRLTTAVSPLSVFAWLPPPGGNWSPMGRDESTVSALGAQDTDGNDITVIDFLVQRMYQYNAKSGSGGSGGGAVFTRNQWQG